MEKQTVSANWRLLADIFWSFFKIAPVTFGGGYAMIPVIEREVVEKRGWITEEEMVDALSIAGSAPGGVGVNAATFIGFRTAGIKGAIAAVIGITLPTFLIVLALSFVFIWLDGNAKMTAAFEGIKSAVVAMIAYAAYRIGRSAVFDKATLATVIGAVAVLLFVKMNPIIVMALGALLGIGLVKLKEKLGMAVRLEKNEQSGDDAGQDKGKPFYRYDDYYIGEGI